MGELTRELILLVWSSGKENWLLRKGKLAPWKGEIGSSGRENWLLGKGKLALRGGKLAHREGKIGSQGKTCSLGRENGRINSRVNSFGELTRELILLV